MFTAISLLFAIVLYTFIFAAVLGAAFLAAHFFCKFLTLFKPDLFLADDRRKERDVEVSEHHERKLVAIDFIVQERLRRQNALRKNLAEKLSAAPLVTVKPPISDEVSLAEIAALAKQIRTAPVQKADEHAAQYTLVKIVNGRKRYLCRKSTRRSETGEIKNAVIFAALPSEAIRLDHTSAERLATVVHGVQVEAANIYARMLERTARDAEQMLATSLFSPGLSTSKETRV